MLSYQVKCYISTSDVPFNFMGNPGDGFLVTRVLNRHRLVDARFHGGPKLVLQLDFTLTSTLTFAFYVERDKMLLETIPISFREKGNCVELACILWMSWSNTPGIVGTLTRMLFVRNRSKVFSSLVVLSTICIMLV